MNTKQLIQQYYDAFNKQDMPAFLNFLAEDVVHDINQGASHQGKKHFEDFMQHMNTRYQEKIHDIVIMINEDGTRAAAEFIVDGVYLQTDKGLPEAKKQTYSLPAGAFFEIKNGKINRVTTYYNLPEWIRQVS